MSGGRETSVVGADGPRFHSQRPTDLRAAKPWHRLAYIVRALPAALAALASELGVAPSGRILDFGCAEQPYRRLFGPGIDYIGADLPGNPDADIDIRPDGTLPLGPDSVDAILSTQVLEHVSDPGVYLAECYRVLRPGGRMLLSTHGLMVYHPDPDDYWRWTGAGLRRALESAGFRIERLEGVMGLGATGLQLVQDSLYWRLPSPLRPVLALLMQSLIHAFERFETPRRRRMNALVFAIVASK